MYINVVRINGISIRTEGLQGMNRIQRFVYFATLSAVSLTGFAQQATNLLNNAGFETQGSSSTKAYYWEMNNPDTHGDSWRTAARSSNKANTGSWAGELKGQWSGDWYGGFWQEAAASPGLQYSASAWFWANSDWSAQKQELKLEFYDASFNLLQTSVTGTYHIGEAWQEVKIASTSPENTAWARLVVNVERAGESGSLYVDDTQLRVEPVRYQNFDLWSDLDFDGCHERDWTLCTGKTVLNEGEASGAGLIISEYIEGSGYNKAIELYNGSGAMIDLSAENYRLQIYRDGGTTPYKDTALSGTIDEDSTFLISCNYAGTDQVLKDAADQLSNDLASFNGDDAIVLRRGGSSGTIIDSIGKIGEDPGGQWGSLDASTADNTIRRKSWVTSGDTDPFDTVDIENEWDGYPIDTFVGIGAHTMDSGGFVPSGYAASIAPGVSNFIQTGYLSDGIGTVSFWYKADGSSPAMSYALETSADGTNWTEQVLIENISNTEYEPFVKYMYEPHHRYLRLIHKAGSNRLIVDEFSVALPSETKKSQDFSTWTDPLYQTDGAYEPDGWRLSTGRISSASARADLAAWVLPQSYIRSPLISEGAGVVTFWYRHEDGSEPIDLYVETSYDETNWELAGTISGVENTDYLMASVYAYTTNASYARIRTGTGSTYVIIDDISIADAQLYRNQDFNLWPTTPYGDSSFQGWSVHAAKIDPQNAYSGNAARMRDTVSKHAWIQSPKIPEGLGPVSFRYRRWSTSGTDPQYALQTSNDGSNWSTIDTLTMTSTEYDEYEIYLYETNNYYLRLYHTAGASIALFDDIAIGTLQQPADVNIDGQIIPANPSTNDAVTFEILALPENGAVVADVYTYYRTNALASYTRMDMEEVSYATYQSVTTIPPLEIGVSVDYYFEVVFTGPGSSFNSPARDPENAPLSSYTYGIPRNNPGQVWINEIDYSHDGTYDPYPTWVYLAGEFVELAGPEGADLSGWTITLDDHSSSPTEQFGFYTFPPGSVLSDDTDGFGFFVLGGSNVVQRDLLMTNTYWPDYNSMYLKQPGTVELRNEAGGLEDSLSYGGYIPGYENLGIQDPDATFSPDWSEAYNTNSIAMTGGGVNDDTLTWDRQRPSPGEINSNQVLLGVSVTARTNLLNEGASAYPAFRISRTGTNDAFQVFFTMQGNATNGTDYTYTPTSVTFSAGGSAHQDITITPLADGITDGDKSLELHLSAPSTNLYFNIVSNDTVTLFDVDRNRAPTVDAGTNRTVSALDASVYVRGSVLDDGKTGVLSNEWSQLSGTGTVTFDSPHSPTSRVSFSSGGTYTLRLTANDSEFEVFDDVTFTVIGTPPLITSIIASNDGTTVEIKYSQPVTHETATNFANYAFSGGLSLSETELRPDDQTLLLTVTPMWPRNSYTVNVDNVESIYGYSITNTISTVTLSNLLRDAAMMFPTNHINKTGNWTYGTERTFCWYAQNNSWAIQKPGSIIFNKASPVQANILQVITNPPAGEMDFSFYYQEVNYVSSPNLGYAVKAYTNDTLTLSLSEFPTNAAFENPASQGVILGGVNDLPTTSDLGSNYFTTFTIPAGTKLLAVVFHGETSSQFDYIFVNDVALIPQNEGPVVNAGPDRMIGLASGTATMQGSVSDDGKPAGSTILPTWSYVSGPSEPSIEDTHSVSTDVSFEDPGTYILRLSADDTAVTNYDDVSITVDADAPSVTSKEITSPKEIVLTFSEPLSKTRAETASNYQLLNGPTVLSATLDDSGMQVTLRLISDLVDGNSYDLLIQNLADQYSNVLPADLLILFEYNAGFSTDGLAMWLRPDVGLSHSNGVIASWQDASGKGRHATQPDNAKRPLLSSNMLNGYPSATFDGVDDYLQFNLPVNHTSNLTVFTVSAAYPGPGETDARKSPVIAWKESTNIWGGVWIAPHQANIGVRFGQGDFKPTENNFSVNRSVSIGTNWTVTMARKRGTSEDIYADGSQLASQTRTVAHELKNTSFEGYLGYQNQISMNTFLNGEVIEVLVFTNAVSDAQRILVEAYLDAKYWQPIQSDTNEPTQPANLVAGLLQDSGFVLSWDISGDDNGVSGYEVEIAGSLVGTTRDDQYPVSGLQASSVYTNRVRAYDAATNYSDWSTVITTTLTEQVNAPLVIPNGGEYTGNVLVTLTTETQNATIYYTTDGSEPTTGSTEYSSAFDVSRSTIVRAFAWKSGLSSSLTTTSSLFSIRAYPPTITPSGGVYEISQRVMLSCATPDATMYYTLDGTEPTIESLRYTNGVPFTLTSNAVLTARAYKSGMLPSDIAEATFVRADVPQQNLAAWFRSDLGITTLGSAVWRWSGQSPNSLNAQQDSADFRPTLISNAINGYPAIRFDGQNDSLNFNLPVNGLENLTIFIVSSSRRSEGDNNPDTCTLLGWEETGSWGGIRINAHQDNIQARLGNGIGNTFARQIENKFTYWYPTSLSNSWNLYTVHKDSVDEFIYLNGVMLNSQTRGTPSNKIWSTGNQAWIGYANYSANLPCDVAEILVYTNELDSPGLESVHNYLNNRYFNTPKTNWFIVSTHEGQGSITPSGVLPKNNGENQEFTITPAPGYSIQDVLINGVSIGATSNYTWSNITDDGNIHAVFGTDNAPFNDTPIGWLAAFYPSTNDYAAAALSDTDGDGMPAWKEFLANTDPTDPASVLLFTNTASAPTGNGMVLYWDPQTGVTYSVFYSTNILQGYNLLQGNISHPQGSLTDSVHSGNGVLIYKIHVHRE